MNELRLAVFPVTRACGHTTKVVAAGRLPDWRRFADPDALCSACQPKAGPSTQPNTPGGTR